MSYTSERIIDLNYVMPDGKVTTEPLPKTLEVQVRASGWELLGTSFRKGMKDIDIDLNEAETSEFSYALLKGMLDRQLNNEAVLSILPNSISWSLEDLAQKKIPVKLNNQIELASTSQYSQPISFDPDSVLIKGPLSILDTINIWQTQALDMKNLDRSIDGAFALEDHFNDNISFYPDSVYCHIEVEALTEKAFSIQLELRNVPDSIFVVTVPDVINVQCQVGLSQYDNLNQDAIEIYADFKEIDFDNEKSLRVNLGKYPEFISRINYSPQFVEFLISK